jgi:hypothetical protein
MTGMDFGEGQDPLEQKASSEHRPTYTIYARSGQDKTDGTNVARDRSIIAPIRVAF